MNGKKSGFTLIELMVVVLIVGILAVVAVPQYMKTVETSKATDAVGLVVMIANAQRSCILDNPSTIATDCPTAQLSSLHPLVVKKYIADHDWGTTTTGTPYNYYTCGTAACAAWAQRKTGTYLNWGYTISNAGVCTPLTADTPSCPGM